MSEAKVVSLVQANELVAEIRASVDQTFTSLFKLKTTPDSHRIETDCVMKGDVSGVLSMIQEGNEGTLILTFPRDTIFAMLSRMYRKEINTIDATVRSGVGELTNIVYGVLKSKLNGKGYALKMAVPSVIMGDHHTVVASSYGPALVMPFKTEVGDFAVSLTFHNAAAAAAGTKAS